MSDDSDLKKQNEFEPGGPSNGGPRNTRNGAADDDDYEERTLHSLTSSLKEWDSD